MSSAAARSAISVSKIAPSANKLCSPNSKRSAFAFQSPTSNKEKGSFKPGQSPSTRFSIIQSGSPALRSPLKKQTTPVKCAKPLCHRLLYDEERQLPKDLEISSPVKNQLLKGGIDSLAIKPQVLGRGGFGIVILASRGGKRIALKVVQRNPKRRNSIELALRGEKRAMALDHPHLIRTLGVVDDIADPLADHTYQNALVFMEFAGSKNLLTVLEDPSEIVSSARRIKFALQLAEALNWCHYKNFLHLDVKPANVIINDQDNCKLGDFGCSRDANEIMGPHHCSIVEGTIAYKAPELLQKSLPTFKADVYSYGITLWQLLTRKQPFAGLDPHVVVYKVVTWNARPICRDRLRDENLDFAQLYEQCWASKELDRPCMSQVMERLTEMQKPITM